MELPPSMCRRRSGCGRAFRWGIRIGSTSWRAPSEITRLIQRPETAREETRFQWKVHSCYGGNPAMTAIEVGPRLESIQYWRFAVPKSVRTARWGVGAAGGGEISPIKFAVAKGSGRYGSCRRCLVRCRQWNIQHGKRLRGVFGRAAGICLFWAGRQVPPGLRAAWRFSGPALNRNVIRCSRSLASQATDFRRAAAPDASGCGTRCIA